MQMPNPFPESSQAGSEINRKLLFLNVLFVLLVISLLIGLPLQISKGITFDTDLLALLPEATDQQISKKAEQQLLAHAGQRIIILLQSQNKQSLLASADSLKTLFCQNPEIGICHQTLSHNQTDHQAFIELFKQHRFYLLSDAHRHSDENMLVEQRLKQLYGFDQSMSFITIDKDPLGLFNNYMEEKLDQLLPYQLYRGLYLIENPTNKQHALALMIQLPEQSMSLDFQQRFNHWFTQQKTKLLSTVPDVALFHSGAIFHAHAAAEQAKHEILIISSLSILGIILVFQLSGLGLSSLLAGLLSLGIGFATALLSCTVIFPKIHLITLVFGASLLGVAIDYALHYLCERHASGQASITRLLPALCLGLISSCIGYGILIKAPMPGLQQIALFSVSGLIGAWLCVVSLFPHVPLSAKRHNSNKTLPGLVLLQRLNTLWLINPKKSFGLLVLINIVCLSIITSKTHLSDSVRSLYASDTTLLAQEKTIQETMNATALNQFFIINAPNPQRLLAKESALGKQLDELINQKQLSDYISLSQIIPTLSEQLENYHRQQAIYRQTGPVTKIINTLQLPTNLRETLNNALEQQQTMKFATAIPKLPKELQALYLGEVSGSYYSIILLKGIESLPALQTLAKDNDIQFHDKVAELSNILHMQQQQAHQHLVWAYLFISVFLLLRYRQIKAVLLTAIPMTSSLLTVTFISLMGFEISLFHSFALFLILGLGMDYAIFLYESNEHIKSTETAIALSAITSCLSFGLLCLSQTPMIAAFGWTILLGSLCNLLLAPSIRGLKQ